jgi:hypothetical protein
MAKKKFDIGKVDYLDIRDLTFTYSMPEESGIPEKQENSTQYTLEIVKMFSLEQEIIRLVFSIHLQTMLPDAKEIKGLYTTEHLFHVNDLSGWINKTEDHFEVNNDVEDTLTGLAYSTVRGLLHQKFNGTWFADFILPVTKPVIAEQNPFPEKLKKAEDILSKTKFLDR